MCVEVKWLGGLIGVLREDVDHKRIMGHLHRSEKEKNKKVEQWKRTGVAGTSSMFITEGL
jgi:hypothetical protein